MPALHLICSTGSRRRREDGRGEETVGTGTGGGTGRIGGGMGGERRRGSGSYDNGLSGLWFVYRCVCVCVCVCVFEGGRDIRDEQEV